MRKTIITFIVLCFVFFSPIHGKAYLADVFTDHMVLQRGMNVPVWGYANQDEEIVIQFNGQEKSTRANLEGEWKIELDPMQHGGPFKMTVISSDTAFLDDILVGDVWLCGGQSNMHFPVKATLDAPKEIASADYDLIRQVEVPYHVNNYPLSGFEGEASWEVCTPGNVPDWTGVGYYFARELFNKNGVPIGLINCNVGGSACEAWMSEEVLANNGYFEEAIREWKNTDMLQHVQKSLVWRNDFPRARKEYIEYLKNNDEGFPEGEPVWHEPGFDDVEWKTMPLPGLWEKNVTSLSNFDGIIWLRKQVAIPSGMVDAKAMINLGVIDDGDMVWVNGVKVGETLDDYLANRDYSIPEGVLKAQTTITVRLMDWGGNGGVSMTNPGIKIYSEGEELPLSGEWKYKIGSQSPSPFTQLMAEKSIPTVFYNAMLNPVIPYGIKGAIWYQGETNAGRAYQYTKLFPLLIENWRKDWAQGDFPFLYVQLTNYARASNWPEMREAQRLALSVPNTGMAVIYDVGDSDDIHPKNKQVVGERLAISAQKVAYGKDVVHSGPMYKSHTIKKDEITIEFDHVGSGLMIKDRYGYLKGFEIAGEDKEFKWCKAWLDGNKVVVSHPGIKEPVAVRYAWYQDPGDANLYNKEGLLACPFRTDNWEWKTK